MTDSQLLLLVIDNCAPEHAAAGRLAAIPGLRRARLAGAVADWKPPKWPYIALYDIDRDPREIAAALYGGELPKMPAADDRSLHIAARAITARLRAKGLTEIVANPLLFVVLTNSVEGREAEFNDWYDNTHLADILAIPGFIAAQRFRLEPLLPADFAWRYLAIYEVAADAATGAFAEMDRRKGTQALPISDALAEERFKALYAVTATA